MNRNWVSILHLTLLASLSQPSLSSELSNSELSNSEYPVVEFVCHSEGPDLDVSPDTYHEMAIMSLRSVCQLGCKGREDSQFTRLPDAFGSISMQLEDLDSPELNRLLTTWFDFLLLLQTSGFDTSSKQSDLLNQLSQILGDSGLTHDETVKRCHEVVLKQFSKLTWSDFFRRYLVDGNPRNHWASSASMAALAFQVQLMNFAFQHKEEVQLAGPVFTYEQELFRGAEMDFLCLTSLPDSMLLGWVRTYRGRTELLDSVDLNSRRQDDNDIARTLLDLFWVVDLPCYLQSASSHPYSDYHQYLWSTLIPLRLQSIIYTHPVTADRLSLSIPDVPASENATVNWNGLHIGEEFEYFVDAGCNLPDEDFVAEELDDWRSNLKEALISEGIEDYSIETEGREDKLYIKARIGNWNCKVYHDYGAIEVNTTPYRIRDVFEVDGNAWTPYQLFQRFIIDLASKNRLARRSCHKHLDAFHSFEGNAELMIRMMNDMENHPEVTRAVRRENRSQDLFPAAVQKSDVHLGHYQAVIAAVNQQLECNPERAAVEDNSRLIAAADLLSQLGIGTKRGLTNLSKIKPCSDTDETPSIWGKTYGTFEYRNFHAVRSGEAALRVNQLLIARLKVMLEQINSHAPLQYEPRDPTNFTDSDDVVRDLIRAYLLESGLDESDYKEVFDVLVPDPAP